MGQPVATVMGEVGMGAVTVAADLGMGDATEEVGYPTGPPQAPPPTRSRELPPPVVALLPEAGVAAKISPGVPPYAERRAMGEEPAGVGGLVGRAPGHAAIEILRRVPPSGL